jgi:hypothetical protein
MKYKGLVLRAAAAAFNLIAIWIIYACNEKEWTDKYYNYLSLTLFFATLSRLGYDLFIAYNNKKENGVLYLNDKNIIIIIILTIISTLILKKITPESEVLNLFFAILLASVVAIFEGIVRSNVDDDKSQFTILIYNNSATLILISLHITSDHWLIILYSMLLSVMILYTYVTIKKITIKICRGAQFEKSSSSISHSIHGLINQQYLIYFITKYLEDVSLPIVLTVIRICSLSTWPLNYYSFSDVFNKSENKDEFIIKYKKLVFFIVAFVGITALYYLYRMNRINYLIPSIILMIGIFTFAIKGFGFFYGINSKRFNYIIVIQFLLFAGTYFLGNLGYISLTLLVLLFSVYLVVCSFSYRLLRY